MFELPHLVSKLRWPHPETQLHFQNLMEDKQERGGQRNFYMPLHTTLYFAELLIILLVLKPILFIYAGTIVPLRLFNAIRGMLQKSNADAHRSCLCTHGLLGWLPPSNLPAARGCFGQHRSLGWGGLFGYWTQWGSCTVLQRVAGSLELW